MGAYLLRAMEMGMSRGMESRRVAEIYLRFFASHYVKKKGKADIVYRTSHRSVEDVTHARLAIIPMLLDEFFCELES